MKMMVGRMLCGGWLCVACLGLLSPLSAREPTLQGTLKGHTGVVLSVAYSPDGRTLASGSQDSTIKLWDVATGRKQATLKGHTLQVVRLAYSPDGKMLASGSVDGTVKLWDLGTGKERATLKGHTDPVTSVAYSPDGKTVASGSLDNTIKLWDVATDKERATLKGGTNHVLSVAYSPDGKTLASGSVDGTIKLWEVQKFPTRRCGLPVWQAGRIDAKSDANRVLDSASIRHAPHLLKTRALYPEECSFRQDTPRPPVFLPPPASPAGS